MKKWSSAEQKRQHTVLTQEWNALKEKYDSLSTSKQTIRKVNDFTSRAGYRIPPGRASTSHIPSLQTAPGVGAKKESIMYTGENVLGISILHKSCLQPIFSETEAKDHASMRR